MAADDVQLPDLEVIQRYSLAVRGATAPRADVIAALRADLDWLTSSAPAMTPVKAPVKAAAKRMPVKTTTTAPAPPKRAPRRTPAKRSTSTPTSGA